MQAFCSHKLVSFFIYFPLKEFQVFDLMQSPNVVTSYGALTVSVMQRNGTGLHGDSPHLFILPAVQISQLTTTHRRQFIENIFNARLKILHYLPSQPARYDTVARD